MRGSGQAAAGKWKIRMKRRFSVLREASSLLQEFRDGVANLIPNPPERGKSLILISNAGGKGGWIIKGEVEYLGVTGKDRAVLVGVAADGDHQIDVPVEVRLDRFGLLPGDVDTRFSHDLDRSGVQAMSFDAC